MKKILTILAGIILGIINVIPFSSAQIVPEKTAYYIYYPYYFYTNPPVVTDPLITTTLAPAITDQTTNQSDPVITTPTQPTITPNEPQVTPNTNTVTSPPADPTYTAQTTTTLTIPNDPIVSPPPAEPDPAATTTPPELINPNINTIDPIDPAEPDNPTTDPPPTDTGTNGITDPRDPANYNPPVYADSTTIIPSATETQGVPNQPANEPNRELECPETTPQRECPNPQTVANNIIPQISANQLKIIFVTLIGALIGAILWMLSRSYVNKAQIQRDQHRLNRSINLSKQEIRLTELEKSFKAIADSTAHLTQSIEKGQNPTPAQIEEYKKSAVELELFASQKTINAHKEFVNLLKNPSPPTEKDYTNAKKTLLEALKSDIQS